MTKYILVGGYPKKAKDGGKAFCEELVKGFSDPVRILDCLFARPRENWDKSFEEDKEFFSIHSPDRKLEIQLADPIRFIDQIRWVNTIYLRGGDNDVLLGLLSQDKNWIKELTGKTFAGSSAGANVIAKYYYDFGALKAEEGLGLLPVKVIVHYRSDSFAPNLDWDKALIELKNYKEDIPIFTLAEGEFKVINQ